MRNRASRIRVGRNHFPKHYSEIVRIRCWIHFYMG